MKKLLVLMLVLGLASAANAMTLKLTADLPGGTVDVDSLDGYVLGDDVYFAVVGDTSLVTVSGGVGTVPPAPADSAVYPGKAIADGFFTLPAGHDGIWGFIGDVAGVATGPGTYIDAISWALVGGANSAEILLVTTTDYGTFTTIDRITVPEPMTIALMGLGGLFLLRRRK